MISIHRIMRFVVVVLVAQLLVTPAFAAVSLGNLDQLVRQLKDKESKLSQQREATFKAEQQKQEQLARDALGRRNAAEARGNVLNKAFDANSAHIDEMKVLLKQHEGNLGELFGVTRQIAGDAAEERIVPIWSELVKKTRANIDLGPAQHVRKLGQVRRKSAIGHDRADARLDRRREHRRAAAAADAQQADAAVPVAHARSYVSQSGAQIA